MKGHPSLYLASLFLIQVLISMDSIGGIGILLSLSFPPINASFLSFLGLV